MVITDDCACLVEGAQVNVYPKKVVVGGAVLSPTAHLAMYGRPWTVCSSSLSFVGQQHPRPLRRAGVSLGGRGQGPRMLPNFLE